MFEANFCQSKSNWMDSNINSHATVPLNQFCHETQRLEDTASRRLEKWKCIRKSSDVPLEKWKGMRGQYSVAKWMQMAQEILFINQGSLEDDIFMTSYDILWPLAPKFAAWLQKATLQLDRSVRLIFVLSFVVALVDPGISPATLRCWTRRTLLFTRVRRDHKLSQTLRWE